MHVCLTVHNFPAILPPQQVRLPQHMGWHWPALPGSEVTCHDTTHLQACVKCSTSSTPATETGTTATAHGVPLAGPARHPRPHGAAPLAGPHSP
eukprot:scaffold203244_cov19-Tisochrysis_lutea.AAC.1